MKLNISLETEHSDIVSSVAWSVDGQLLSYGDDKVLCKWTADGQSAGKIGTINAYGTSLSISGKQAADMFALSCTDGTVRFVSKSGREEKKFSAHEGAVILVRWSHDGSALLTTGEEGDVKIWSKSGNLRSTLISTGQSVLLVMLFYLFRNVEIRSNLILV